MKKLIFLLGISLIVLSACNKKDEACEEYASKYSCEFITKQATYNVWYWKDVEKNHEADNKFVGQAVGLSQCRDTAIYAHRAEMEYRKTHRSNWSDYDDNWSERSYICSLHQDGFDVENHRM